MGNVANAVSRRAGVDAYPLWLAVVAVVCTLLAIGGPIVVVRRWLERFGIYVMLAAGAWITYRLMAAADLGAIWRAPGRGGSFWLGVDLVIAMPVSWLPLVADYNRFARTEAGAFRGTYFGYAIGNVWFFALGALVVLAAGAAPEVIGIGEAILALAGGVVVLAALLAGETDQAFANVYSAAVSVQNIAPRLPQRALIGVVGLLGFVLAAVLGNSAESYELFLLLIGSVFVPLFGVFAADYFVLRRRGGRGAEEEHPGVRWIALVPWIAGFAIFHWSAPSPLPGWQRAMEALYSDWLGAPFPLLGSSLGASLPSFAVAFVLAVALLPLGVRRSRSRRAGERQR
jgi:nucleobase:cation symporter-1, NCS1 family